MEKRCHPPQGCYKSLDFSIIIPCVRAIYDPKPDVLGVFEAEGIVSKRIHNGKPIFMVKWHGYSSSQSTWEPKAHLSAKMIEAFESPDPDPMKEAPEWMGLSFGRGMKIPLQYEESIEIRLNVLNSFLFPNLPAESQPTPTDICDQDLENAGLMPYLERAINANGNWWQIVQLTLRLLLSKSPSFDQDGKEGTRPVEWLRLVFRKKYLLAFDGILIF